MKLKMFKSLSICGLVALGLVSSTVSASASKIKKGKHYINAMNVSVIYKFHHTKHGVKRTQSCYVKKVKPFKLTKTYKYKGETYYYIPVTKGYVTNEYLYPVK
ncbi:hypothetical protein LNP07_04545 [Apilactobacillus sp. M161]|uniref:Surface layer protein A domain-containing protein n=1 Tax=Apilactobacillus xinyiensis TaxID=2841032 RepID=A0ABT0I236_9LACO|nr:hypothetical protein [Apilactobacillus xinyiensis]MCK8624780.1 hypothetical protein [Apilactobacillus xinyiensis]